MRNTVIYICGGRSFISQKLGRKMSEVIECFSRVSEVRLYCGGDISNHTLTENPAMQLIKKKSTGALRQFVINTVSELRDILNDRQLYHRISRSEKTNTPAVVIERSSRLHIAGLRYARKMGIPFVLEWKDHLLDYKYSLFKAYAKHVEKRKLMEAEFILVESEVLQHQLEPHIGPNARIIVAYNAVDSEEFVRNPVMGEEVRRSVGISQNDVVVGYVGSYTFYHDSERMILAAEIACKVNPRIKFLLVGNGRDRELCHRLASEKGLLNTSVFMLSSVAKELVPKYLSAMDITLLPGSTDIICPIKVMEYMAAGTVPMVPDYACNREIVDESVGVLFTPFDENDMAEKIIRLADDGQGCSTLRENARRKVVDYLSWDETYGKALREILQG